MWINDQIYAKMMKLDVMYFQNFFVFQRQNYAIKLEIAQMGLMN